VEVRAYRPSDHDAVVGLWRTVFPDAPARNDPVLDIQRKARVQPELFEERISMGKVLPPGRVAA